MTQLDFLEKALNHEEMIRHLKNMGLTIPNVNFAISVLKNIHYYKFIKIYGKKYLIDGEDRFLPNTRFDYIYYLYKFDSEFCRLLEPELRNTEVKVLSAFIDHFCIKYGIFSHMDSNCFLKADLYKRDFKEIFKKSSEDLSKTPLYKLDKYITFGALSKLLNNLKRADKVEICNLLNINSKYCKLLSTWVRNLSQLRNLCAHNNRIYDTVFQDIELPNNCSEYDQYSNSVFGSLMIMTLFIDEISLRNLILKLKLLENNYLRHKINLSILGFPSNWNEILMHVNKSKLI